MSLTIIVIFSTAIFLTIYDIFIIEKQGKSESISAYVIRGSKKYPAIVLCFGILLGHLFWSMKTDDIYKNVECKNIKKENLKK